MQNLSGKTAVITGAGSGIGRAFAHRFAAAGMKLVLADINATALANVAEALTDAGHEAVSQVVDVGDYDQIVSLDACARDAFGKVHLLCNNAGIGSGGLITEPDDLATWRHTLDVNLWSVIYGCKVFTPAMIEHGEPAHIVNTASLAGLLSAPFIGAYGVSKYGVVALSEILAQEMAMHDTQVGVSVLCPSFVKTAIADPRPEATPEELANPMAVAMRDLVSNGTDPAEIADAVHDAVVANQFWILPHEGSADAVVQRAERIAAGVNPEPSGLPI